MNLALRLVLALAGCWLASSPLRAQDLYDPTVLRTINLQFHDANWEALLRSNYVSETNILADLSMDGTSYPNVGVRIRGNTSYTALPTGSQKFSLKVDMEFTTPGLELMGYDNLNFNNSFHDPTFSREVIYNNFVAQFIPNPRSANILLTLNGANWGVYVNVQQADKKMLRDYFTNADGVRIGCSNNPNGPGLRYNGATASGYTAYGVLNDGGIADPITTALIPVTNALTNGPLATWQDIDLLFAIDPSIWSVVLENLLTDDDSYVNKGCDFMTYRDPLDNRLHLIQRDANESFTVSNWLVTRNFTSTNKPVLNRLVMGVPELRQRFMAHYRTARKNFDWNTTFGPLFAANRSLIDAAVQADPKKLYTYAQFQSNFTSTVNLGGSPPAGGSVIGLQQFFTDRNVFLDTNAELTAVGPTISNLQPSNATPSPSEPVHITAAVATAGSPITKVDLYYRTSPANVYQRTPMLDDGNSGDGAPADGVFGALLPISATPGQVIKYYVAATATNANSSMSFLPELAERGPRRIDYGLGAADGMRITEWMYSGMTGEYTEFTNTSNVAIDMTGWSMDDDHAIPGAFPIGAFGIVQPGESVIVTDAIASDFRTAWNLAASVKIIGQLGITAGNSLGRGDQIHLYDAANVLQDRLFYGDQVYTGTIRTQNRSGQAPCSIIGQNDIAGWVLSTVGDSYGSVAATSGDVGTPGLFPPVNCNTTETIFSNGFESGL